MTKQKKLCSHDTAATRRFLLFRCACGNVWIEGRWVTAVPQDRSAVDLLGLLGAPQSDLPQGKASR